MARISGVDLPREKRIEIGLTYVYGIGRVRATKILAEAGVNPDTRVKDLTDEEVAKIAKVIDADPEHLVEGDLRREVAMNIKRLKEIGCYRGIRHRKGLPVRGQKTKTNARTCKGPKKTVANKKKQHRRKQRLLRKKQLQKKRLFLRKRQLFQKKKQHCLHQMMKDLHQKLPLQQPIQQQLLRKQRLVKRRQQRLHLKE